MKALAEYIVRGRWQAVQVAVVSGVMTFMLPPFTTVLNYLVAAVIALVTLHIGILPGLQVLSIAAALTVLFYQLLGVQAAAVLIMVAMLWLPCWMLAAVLQHTRRLERALTGAVLFGAVLLLTVYGLFGDPVPWWIERLHAIQELLEQAGLPVANFSDEQLLQDVAALLTGLVLASLLVGVIGSLLLARWWQSVLIHPGGFRDEFCSLRLGHMGGLLTLCAMLVARFTTGTTGQLVTQLAMIMLVPYLLAGLAVIHSVVRQSGRSNGWLVAVYVALSILPQATLLLAGAGLLDTWVDFRRRLQSRGNRP
jgi:hypothetical protein